MLQYLVILLDKTSTSFCQRDNQEVESQLMSLQNLKSGIRFGMIENLMIQFVYPDKELPCEYKKVIDDIDHNDVVSSLCEDKQLLQTADVVVFHDWTALVYIEPKPFQSYVIRTTKNDFFEYYRFLKNVLCKVAHLSIIITDVETFMEEDFEKYKQVLNKLSFDIEKMYIDGNKPQLNLLTDRFMLSQFNNCGAGDTCITLAPNGKFYVCPAYYYEDEKNCIGDLQNGLDIKNPQLYKLSHAPLCRNCDAYQCKRCVWLNRKTTYEVNTPSHEQCVVAHLERNASRDLLLNIRKHGTFLPDKEIKEINYLDPFDVRKEW